MTNGQERPPKAFVLMPFQPEFDAIYSDLIVPALDEAGYEVKRADSLLDQRNILADIVRGIAEADLVIAELTILNPNVLYELGIAHGLMKPTIMITQDIGEIPFDLRSYRVIKYSVHYNEVALLQAALRGVAQSHQRGEVTFGNPVMDFAPELPAVTTRPAVEEGTFESIEEEAEEPPGLLDFVNDALAAMEDIGQHTVHLNEYTEALGGAIEARTAELEAANARGGPGAAAQQRRIVGAVASEVNDYVQRVNAELGSYEASWNRFVDNTTGMVSMVRIDDSEDREDTVEFRNTLVELRASIEGGLQGIQSFRTSLSEVRGLRLSRELNQSLRGAERTLSSVIDLFTTGDSYLSRIVNVLDERLGTSEGGEASSGDE
jgi:hypothetical protein